MMEVCITIVLIICFFGLTLLTYELRERKELSDNNKFELNCLLTKQDEKGNFPELKIQAKNFDQALNIKRKYESMGWVVILTVITKPKGKKDV